MKGSKGDNGEPGGRGESGTPFNLITLHSQTNSTPACLVGSVQLWEGYTMGFTDGDGFGHGQDLGKPGSCVHCFNTIPFMMCRGRGENSRCYYSFRSGKTYWLSTNAAVDSEEIPMDEHEDHISCCSVCEIDSAILTVNSQSNSIPDCPSTWQSVWTGYSFLMNTGVAWF
ncbi:collagen alpha-2(IV) chain-like [Dysidea avara]|uniref:collagen alpha-2(IV) chain-like n=1 Tax=Dysidea avara TaxID=196820 RepID=UPI00333171D6